VSSIVLHRAAERFFTVEDGAESWHCFSFGKHYDPTNTAFGPLVAHNDTVLQPGSGFAPHRHADLEIVTWVVRGVLHHEDSTGHRGDIHPGVVQRLSAGAGVVHSEGARPPSAAGHGEATSTRFVQMWVTPDEPGGQAAYAHQEIDSDALAAGLVVVASGRGADRPPASVTIARRGAALLAGRIAPGQSRRLPSAELVHLYVVTGAVELETGQRLTAGDSARLKAAPDMDVCGVDAAELLVWELDLTE
jgi:redox-sensitive bicupin YhaK (pirin superfamily)